MGDLLPRGPRPISLSPISMANMIVKARLAPEKRSETVSLDEIPSRASVTVFNTITRMIK